MCVLYSIKAMECQKGRERVAGDAVIAYNIEWKCVWYRGWSFSRREVMVIKRDGKGRT